MPVNPAPPQDLEALTDALGLAAQSVADSAHGLRDEKAESAGPHEGWLLSDHVHAGAQAEAWLDEALGGVPDEPLTEDAVRAAVIRTWLHGQALRAALGRPGDQDSAGATLATAAVLTAVPDIVRGLGLPAGHQVIVESTGPVTGRTGARSGEGGEVIALFSGDDAPPTGAIPVLDADGHAPTPVTTSLHLSTDALTGLASGRVPVEAVHLRAEGDDEVVQRVLEGLRGTLALD